MKTLIATVFLGLGLLFTSTTIHAQAIHFCEDVSDDGYPISEGTTFYISSSGSYFYVLVELPYELLCRSARFEITRNGDYFNTIYIDAQADWVRFWKRITFYSGGYYYFKVYDGFDLLLTSGGVNVQMDDSRF